MESNLSEQDLYIMQQQLSFGEIIILKFTADWCGPCKGIKELVEDLVKQLPKSIKYYEINIDESLELYAKFKNKKMVNGIPAILAFKDGVKDYWYVPDFSVLGGNKNKIIDFFKQCNEYVSK